MARQSAGILPYRHNQGRLEVFLIHPGGPFWATKDAGAWSIPKGLFRDDEDSLAAAKREFREETGFEPAGEMIPLEPVRQPGGKLVHAWAMEGDFDPEQLRSNTFSMEWPRGSGQQREFPEVDRGAWFTVEEAARKILPGQAPFLAQLFERLPRD
jgi:predicted NUDIX family NTP pyrophosphohydrolase